MKTIILRMLALIGLAPASHVALAQERARRATGKVTRLGEELDRLRSEREAWKQRHREATAAAATGKNAARRAAEEAVRAKAAADRASAHADEWKARAQALTTDLRELRERLEESRRIGGLAREHLMATEVKLDLIEAAIVVLDARTRTSEVPSP